MLWIPSVSKAALATPADEMLAVKLFGEKRMTSEASVIINDLLVEDGDSAYDTSAEVAALIDGASTSVFTRIWQKTVAAQTLARWGYGDPRLPTNQGFVTFAAGNVRSGNPNVYDEGVIQFVVENAPGTARRFQGRIASVRCHSRPSGNEVAVINALYNNRQDMPPFPMGDGEAIMDSKLVLEWRKVSDGGQTVNQCQFVIPSTLYA